MRTLSSLVRANVEGLLGDVAIAGPSGQGLGLIADQAGCGSDRGGDESEWLRRAIEAARGPQLFLLRSGFAPEEGFVEEAGDFLQRPRQAGSGAARASRGARTFVERLFPRAAPLAGLIAPRDQCLEGAAERRSAEFAALAESLTSARRLRTHARRIG